MTNDIKIGHVVAANGDEASYAGHQICSQWKF
jgi:hypothetical protein